MKILLKDDPILEKAHKVYRKFNADDRLVELNEARMKRIRDEATLIEGAREEGRQQGREEGIDTGIRQKAVETARNMLARGYPEEEILGITGLTKEELSEVKTME